VLDVITTAIGVFIQGSSEINPFVIFMWDIFGYELFSFIKIVYVTILLAFVLFLRRKYAHLRNLKRIIDVGIYIIITSAIFVVYNNFLNLAFS